MAKSGSARLCNKRFMDRIIRDAADAQAVFFDVDLERGPEVLESPVPKQSREMMIRALKTRPSRTPLSFVDDARIANNESKMSRKNLTISTSATCLNYESTSFTSFFLSGKFSQLRRPRSAAF